MSSSLSTATPVRHIKASFLHGRDGGKAGQVAVAAAAIANSIAQQQQQSQPPHQPKRPSVGEGTATTTTSTSTKSTSHRNGLAGQSTTTTTAAAAAAAKSEPREAASSSADLSTIAGFSSSPSFSSSASVSPVLVNGAASAELNGDDIISSTSDTTDLAPSPPPALPPPPVDDNNNNNKSITTTTSTNHLSNGNSAGEENGGTITTTNPLKVPPKPKPRPSTLSTTATTNKPLKWPPPLKSPKSPRKTTSAASSFNFAAATASVKHHNFGRSKSHQRPPIPRKPSFLRKKRPQSAFCNSTAESGSSTSDSTEVVNGEHDDFEEEEYEESEVILEDSNDDQPQQQNGFSSSTTCTQTSSSSPSPSSSSSSSNSATVNSSGRPLPPPPVPPRPRLIPAHYALQNRSKPAVETRDAAVDTSENGFHEYHLSEKEVQVKLGLAARTPGHSLLSSSQDSADSAELLNCGLPPVATAALRSFEETNLDDDEEPTIVDDKVLLNRLPNTADFSEYSVKDDEISEQVPEDDNQADTLNTATSASVYEDARSRLTGQLTTTTSQRQQAANHAGAAAPHEPYELSDNDDDTINDELSSFASEYQSFCSSVRSEPHSTAAAAGALGAAPFAEPEPGLSPVPPQSQTTTVSWLHRQHPPTTTTTTDQPQQTQSVSTDKHTIGGNTSTTEEEYLTAMDGPGPASNRSSLISNDPMLEEEEMEEARHQATGMSFDDFRRTFANSMVVSGVGADGDDEEEPAGGASTSAASAAANNNNNNNSSGQAMSADAKRFNRQSVISTISSASSDTSSSIFHTHSSSPSSSYSFDSSASLTSIPQAHISSIASTSSTSTSKRSSVFYTNVTAPIAAAVEAAEEAMQSEASEVTRTSDLGTSVASSSVTVAAVESGGQVLVEDGCAPSKLATSSSSLGEVVVLSPNPQSLPENLSRLPSATPKGSEPTKEYYLAYEMWLTERDYVDVLQMLTKEFREAVQGTVNGYFLNKFFRPLDQVLPINERLLKELEQRVLVDWDDNPKISDIMIKICPFFKEYSIFVREFDQLNHMLDEASELFPDFNAALTAFQRTDRCKKLSIKNYLLKPIQRLPQYPLLITTYLKKLKSDDPDYENTQRALKVVTEVVEHVNRESHQAEKALKLAELKNRIISKTPDAIVKPGRELIKEGPLLKISRKEVQERYFILFNDALLYLVPVMNEMIRLNEEFPLDGMEVDISNQSDREFVIRSMRRSFALMARSKDERAAWVEALEGAIAENDAKKNSFETARGHSNSCGNSSSYSSLDRRSSSPHRSASRLQDSFSSDHHHHHHDLEHSPSMSSTDEHHHSTPEGPHHQSLHHQPSSASTTSSASIETARRNTNPNNAVSTLGERAPVWVHDYRVSMCQGCMREFTIFFRRHHCRACGSVVCSDCSTHHYPLRYRKMEPQRVCDNCYQTLSTLHPEWLNGGGGGGGGGNSGHGNGGTPTGSNRVSPNNSLSAADAAALKRKSRSNSCTHLDDSFNWANGPENGGSGGGGGGGLHNQSLPVGGTILEQQDQNHNPTSSGSLLSPSTLVRGPIRFSSRFARKNIPAVLVEVQANDASCKQSGFMYRLSAKKSWKRFWFVIKEMVLYTYRASEDVAALESLPLPGFKVATSKEAIKGYPAALIIELSHPGQSTIYFFTENPEAHQRWLKAFRECAELH